MGEEVLALLRPRTIQICSALLDRDVKAVAVAHGMKAHAVRVTRLRAEERVSDRLGRQFRFPRLHLIGRPPKKRAAL
jgi:hypothetical protein